MHGVRFLRGLGVSQARRRIPDTSEEQCNKAFSANKPEIRCTGSETLLPSAGACFSTAPAPADGWPDSCRKVASSPRRLERQIEQNPYSIDRLPELSCFKKICDFPRTRANGHWWCDRLYCMLPVHESGAELWMEET